MSKNDITGDKLQSKPNTDLFRDNYDRIRWNVLNKNRTPKKPGKAKE